MSKKMLVVDGYSQLFRAFYALPVLSNKDGEYTNAVYGFLTMLEKVLKNVQPDYLAVALDTGGPTFRHEKVESYKAGRKEPPEELIPQFALIREVLEALTIPILSVQGYEADDVLGLVSRVCEDEGVACYILTGDRDALQLVTDTTHVLLSKREDTQEFDPARVMEVFCVTPSRITDLKGLMGDASDNIPGIAGVGEKTAVKLLTEYGTLESVLEHAHEIKGKLGEKVQNGKESATLSKWLATIVRDVPLAFSPTQCPVSSWESGREIFTRLGFARLLERMGPGMVKQEELPQTPSLSFDAEVVYDTLSALEAGLKSLHSPLAICLTQEAFTAADVQGQCVRVPLAVDLLTKGLALDDVLKALSCLPKNAQVLLYDQKEWLHRGAQIDGMDEKIAAYLLSAQAKEDRPQSASALLQKAKDSRDNLKRDGLLKLYDEVEHPLSVVLYGMEKVGFQVDREELARQGAGFVARMEELKEGVFALAGEAFNLNSPKQLGEILFDKLGLPPSKKTRTGYSTNVEVLEKLEDEHPIIAPIMEYRSLAKLQGTYIEGMIALIGSDGRIHTRFDQIATATGRISSQEPNLQNIPVRTPLGRGIRKAFVAPAGKVLVDADYSQIELRVLAHMAGDKAMQEAFLQGQDIHTRVAAEIAGVPLDEVTPQMRSAAKSVNFGIVYGISDWGLAKNIGISKKEAADFITRYQQSYPAVWGFMQEQIALGKSLGYVQTLLGRRRYITEFKSPNAAVRAFGSRAAMNAPIQGTAADIIKLAMVKVHQALKTTDLDAALILQVHDELILECKQEQAEEVASFLKEQMETAFTLCVPLQVDVHYASCWYDTK